MKLIFHVGMGKTGSTTLQAALAQNKASLAAARIHYQGQWMGLIRPEFDLFEGFQSFLRQSPEGLKIAAQELLDHAAKVSDETGAQTILISNEQYLENIPALSEFFTLLARQADLQIIIFVRPPATWLPSAYTQWGVTHKTNLGPVMPFGLMARQLMKQYDHVQQWRQLLGARVTVRLYDENTDAVEEFGHLIGVELASASQRKQVRPPVSETLMRAAYNNSHHQMVLPQAFNNMMRKSVPPQTPAALTAKFNTVFNYSEIPTILEENTETLNYLESEFGMNLTGRPAPAPPPFDLSSLTDEMVGRMLDLLCSQARQIADLTARLDILESTSVQK